MVYSPSKISGNRGYRRYAKTLYKPAPPPAIQESTARYAARKPPHFFLYAKGKEAHQVQEKNRSTVNRLEELIPNRRMSFTATNLGRFDYRVLMRDPRTEIDDAVVSRFSELEGRCRYLVRFGDEEAGFGYLRDHIRAAMTEEFGELAHVADILVKQLFHIRKSEYKSIFWLCFGDIACENLERNLDRDLAQCEKCGRRFVRLTPQKRLCERCGKSTAAPTREIRCLDCKKLFSVDRSVRNKKRCDECQKRADKDRYRKYYEQHKLKAARKNPTI